MKLKLKKICSLALLGALLTSSVSLTAFAGGDDNRGEFDYRSANVSDALFMVSRVMGVPVEVIRHTCPDLVSVDKAYERAFTVQQYKITTRLGKAISEGDIKTVAEIVKVKPEYLNDEPVWKDVRPEDPDTALRLAIKHKQFEIVKFLVDNGATHAMHCRRPKPGEFRFLREYDPYGVVYLALEWGALRGLDETDIKIIDYLLSHGFRFYDESGRDSSRIPVCVSWHCDSSVMRKVNNLLDKYQANFC